MRIGISGYIGVRKTGIGRTIENVLIQMARAHPTDTFIVFTNYDQDDFLIVDWPENVTLVTYRVSCRSPLLNIVWHQFVFQFNVKRWRCDCCLIPNFSLLLWKVVPTVVVIYDLIEFNVPEKFSKLRVFYRRMIVPLMAVRSDAIITISQSSMDDITKFLHVDPRKITVALCSHDGTKFNEKEHAEILSVLHEYH